MIRATLRRMPGVSRERDQQVEIPTIGDVLTLDPTEFSHVIVRMSDSDFLDFLHQPSPEEQAKARAPLMMGTPVHYWGNEPFMATSDGWVVVLVSKSMTANLNAHAGQALDPLKVRS